MNRVRVPITNVVVGPALTTLYVGSSIVDMTAIKTFFNSLTNVQPNLLTYTIPVSGDQINEADGKLTGVWTGSNGGTAGSAAAAAAFSATSGAVIDWITSAIVGRRRVMGRTFVVPLTGVSYANSGQISSTTITTIQNAANTLITALAGELKIWHRPTKLAPNSGVAAQVVSARVPSKPMVLRSRRQ